MAQWWRVLSALAEDQLLVPSTHIVTQDHLELLLNSSDMHMAQHIYASKTHINKQTNKSKTKKENKTYEWQ